MAEPRNARKDPASRVRQLLLSGDNIIKNRDNAERYTRARERFVAAHQIAREAGLDAAVVELIERRLAALPEGEGGAR
jgi:hypothetical protein